MKEENHRKFDFTALKCMWFVLNDWITYLENHFLGALSAVVWCLILFPILILGIIDGKYPTMQGQIIICISFIMFMIFSVHLYFKERKI